MSMLKSEFKLGKLKSAKRGQGFFIPKREQAELYYEFYCGKVSRKDIATELGVALMSLSAMLRGKITIRPVFYRHIRERLNLPPSEALKEHLARFESALP
jgi:transcriptional regulator with XRE-family HTH domain